MRWLILPLLCLLSGCPKPPPAYTAPSLPPPKAATVPAVPVPPAGQGQTVRVLCDPGVAGVLEQLRPELERRGDLKLDLSERDSLALAASSGQGKLVGAADAFIYAELDGVLAKLRQAQAIDEYTLRTFAGDRLCVACRRGEDWGVPTLFDIYRLRFTWLGLAPEDTALGQYALQALKSDGALRRVQKRIKYLPDGAELPRAIIRDEVQLAVVYASTAAQHPELGIAVLVDPGLHEDIRYRAAAAAGKGAEPGVTELSAPAGRGRGHSATSRQLWPDRARRRAAGSALAWRACGSGGILPVGRTAVSASSRWGEPPCPPFHPARTTLCPPFLRASATSRRRAHRGPHLCGPYKESPGPEPRGYRPLQAASLGSR